MKKQSKKLKETKKEKKAILSFTDRIKELAKTFFILYLDTKKEIAIVKEKLVDLSSPKNVLHVQEGNAFHADYVSSVKEHIGIENFYRTTRTGRGQYNIHPCLAGLFYHFFERIDAKKKLYQGKKDLLLKNISCDLKNLNKFICRDLENLIAKDFPALKLTAKNSLNNFLTIKNIEKGEIVFQAGK